MTKLHGHTIQNVRQLALNMYSYDVGEKAEGKPTSSTLLDNALFLKHLL
jgi:hypothetical protein